MVKKPKYIDIHAHTNFTAFDADRGEVVGRALNAGVWMINIGTQQDTSKKAVDMTHEFSEGVYAIVGLHPVHVNPSHHDTEELGGEGKAFTSRGEDFDPAFYRKLVAEAPKDPATGKTKVVGIGECGLDYYRAPSELERTRQVEAFKGQIELALECDLPLMLHIRSAYRDALDILSAYKKELVLGQRRGSDGAIWPPERLRGDAHFFAGTVEDAREFLALGFHLSYTGVATFAKQYKELIEATPLDRIMSETDCPYVAPVPMRGKRNEPSYVAYVADKIAEIKERQEAGGPTADNIRATLVENAIKLFKL